MEKPVNTPMDNRTQNNNPVTQFHMIIRNTTESQQYINKGTLIKGEAGMCI